MFLKSQAAMNKIARVSKTVDATGSGASGAATEAITNISTQVQAAVLELLGRLGGLNQHMLKEAHLTVQDALVWSDRACLLFQLPVADVQNAGKCFMMCFEL